MISLEFKEKVCSELECSVCRGILKDPKVLQCSHTFCRECLEKHYAYLLRHRAAGTDENPLQEDELECPTCRQITVLPEQTSGANGGRVANLSTNLTLKNVAYLVGTESERDANRRLKIFCTSHSTPARRMYLDNFCAQCDELVCNKCMHSSRHRDHKQNIHDAVDVLQNHVKKLRAFVNDTAAEAISVRQELEAVQKQITKNREDIIRVIEISHEKKLYLLRKRTDGLLAAVHENVAGKLAALQQSLQALDKVTAYGNQTSESMEQALKEDDIGILAKEGGLMAQLKVHQETVQQSKKIRVGGLDSILKFDEGPSTDHVLSTFGRLTECECEAGSSYGYPRLQFKHELKVGEDGEVYTYDVRSQPYDPNAECYIAFSNQVTMTPTTIQLSPHPFTSPLPPTGGPSVPPMDNQQVQEPSQASCAKKPPNHSMLQPHTFNQSEPTNAIPPLSLEGFPRGKQLSAHSNISEMSEADAESENGYCSASSEQVQSLPSLLSSIESSEGRHTYFNEEYGHDTMDIELRNPTGESTTSEQAQPLSPRQDPSYQPSGEDEHDIPQAEELPCGDCYQGLLEPFDKPKQDSHYESSVKANAVQKPKKPRKPRISPARWTPDAGPQSKANTQLCRAKPSPSPPPPNIAVCPEDHFESLDTGVYEEIPGDANEPPTSTNCKNTLTPPVRFTSLGPPQKWSERASVNHQKSPVSTVDPTHFLPPTQMHPRAPARVPHVSVNRLRCPHPKGELAAGINTLHASIHPTLCQEELNKASTDVYNETKALDLETRQERVTSSSNDFENVYEEVKERSTIVRLPPLDVCKTRRPRLDSLPPIPNESKLSRKSVTLPTSKHDELRIFVTPKLMGPPICRINPVGIFHKKHFIPDSEIDIFPSGVCCTNSPSNIVITDVGSHCLRVVDMNGRFVSTIGERGTRNGCFNMPVSIATSPDGCLYVVDQLNSRIQKFTAGGLFVLKFREKTKGRQILKHPEGVAVRKATGDVYVADSEKKRVYVYQNDGNYLRPIGKTKQAIQFSCPVGVVITKSDHLLVLDRSPPNSHCVWSIRQPEEELIRKIGEGILENPSGIAVTDDGTILVTEMDTGSVCVFSSLGEPICRFGGMAARPGMFHLPCGIFVKEKWSGILVADKANNRVQVFLLEDILKRH